MKKSTLLGCFLLFRNGLKAVFAGEAFGKLFSLCIRL